jgi:hypothetical protein
MADGAKPGIKEGRTIRVPEDKRLTFVGFSGEVMLKHAHNGRALLLVIHDDGHAAYFEQGGSGWDVT